MPTKKTEIGKPKKTTNEPTEAEAQINAVLFALQESLSPALDVILAKANPSWEAIVSRWNSAQDSLKQAAGITEQRKDFFIQKYIYLKAIELLCVATGVKTTDEILEHFRSVSSMHLKAKESGRRYALSQKIAAYVDKRTYRATAEDCGTSNTILQKIVKRNPGVKLSTIETVAKKLGITDKKLSEINPSFAKKLFGVDLYEAGSCERMWADGEVQEADKPVGATYQELGWAVTWLEKNKQI